MGLGEGVGVEAITICCLLCRKPFVLDQPGRMCYECGTLLASEPIPENGPAALYCDDRCEHNHSEVK